MPAADLTADDSGVREIVCDDAVEGELELEVDVEDDEEIVLSDADIEETLDTASFETLEASPDPVPQRRAKLVTAIGLVFLGVCIGRIIGLTLL